MTLRLTFCRECGALLQNGRGCAHAELARLKEPSGMRDGIERLPFAELGKLPRAARRPIIAAMRQALRKSRE